MTLKLLTLDQLALVLYIVFMPSLAMAFVEFGEFKKTEFSPQREETFSFPVQLSKDVQSIEIKLYTVDGDVVPDEVYVPILEAVSTNGKKKVIDSRSTTGGEIVEDLQIQITADKTSHIRCLSHPVF